MKRRLWPVIFSLFLGASRLAWGEVKYSPGESRDPFFEKGDASSAPSTPSLAAVESVALDGILWSPVFSSARINGQRVKVGDHVGGAEVVMIDKKGIRLKRGGKEGYLTRRGIQWA